MGFNKKFNEFCDNQEQSYSFLLTTLLSWDISQRDGLCGSSV